MSNGKIISPSEVDFWLDTDKYNEYVDDISLDVESRTQTFSINLIRLASIRKSISNFVRILTRKSIPVYFNDNDVNINISNKIIYISAEINNKYDFDVAVGLSLHEAGHTLKTDWDVLSDMWANLPPSLLKKSDALNIRRPSIEKFIHRMWNIIEDRYIDNYVFQNAPGYRGYYAALYKKFWDDPNVDKLLVSDKFRYPSLSSYDFRICYFTNPNTDLTALSRLNDIADVIDLSDIGRLSSTQERVQTAFNVVEIVLECVDKQSTDNFVNKVQGQIALTPIELFGSLEEEGEGIKDEEPEDNSTKIISEISDILSGKDKTPDKFNENTNAVGKICENETPDLKETHEDLCKKQRQFFQGKIPKSLVSPEQKDLLDLIEQHGIILVKVGSGIVLPGDHSKLKVECIVVKKMTKELILKGHDLFPLSGVMSGDINAIASDKGEEAVKKGIILGAKLGRKLQIRSETNINKILRKKSGKINKRQLHEAAFDAEDLFFKINTEYYNKAILHISVDASSSMQGEKWYKTLTSVVAICKATSMIDNIHVTVSFRSTQSDNSRMLPYVVLAYDSRKDKFSKVKQLFPYLEPSGCTPEGLAFEATMDLFEQITPDEEDRYFLNLSDGEPYFQFHDLNNDEKFMYADEIGVEHTKCQVNKMRRKGVEILSYFIVENPFEKPPASIFNKVREDKDLEKSFKKMYGPSAQFINVNSVVELANTINKLFLSERNDKNS
jgi:hypothetical protein